MSSWKNHMEKLYWVRGWIVMANAGCIEQDLGWRPEQGLESVHWTCQKHQTQRTGIPKKRCHLRQVRKGLASLPHPPTCQINSDWSNKYGLATRTASLLLLGIKTAHLLFYFACFLVWGVVLYHCSFSSRSIPYITCFTPGKYHNFCLFDPLLFLLGKNAFSSSSLASWGPPALLDLFSLSCPCPSSLSSLSLQNRFPMFV